jgi:hypothetical protein
VMILLDLLVWICSSVLSWILAPVGSLQIYILLTPDVLLDAELGIPDSYFFLPVVLLGSSPWHFATSERFCNPSSGGYKLSSHLGTHNGCNKVHRTCPAPTGRSTLVFLLHNYLLPDTPCFHSLPRPFCHITRLSDFALHGCLHCGIFAFACSLCWLLLNIPFYCYMRPLHRQIYWLLPLTLTPSSAFFSLPLPRGPNDEGQPKKDLLLSCQRRLLQNFWLHSSVVYKSAEFHLSSVRTTWFLPVTLGVCMLSENFLRIGSLVLPNSQWNRWVVTRV